MKTQKILDELFEAVAENLKTAIIDFNELFENETNTLIRLAKELNLDIPDNIKKNKGSIVTNTARVVLLPVAEACVLAILRQLLEIAHNRYEPFHIPLNRFDKFVLRSALQSKRFKRAIGFNYEIKTDYDKVITAITITRDVLLQIGLLKTATELEIGENRYEIYRSPDGNGFYVRRIAEH